VVISEPILSKLSWSIKRKHMFIFFIILVLFPAKRIYLSLFLPGVKYDWVKLQPVAREVHMGCPMITEACWSDERGCRHGGAIPISLVSDWFC